MRWAFLGAAIVLEVLGTLSLRAASAGNRAWYTVVAVGYLGAFAAISVSLADGMPLGIAYGIWAASGVALTALATRALFDEPLTAVMLAGIALIATGVLLVELGASQ